MSLQTGSSRMFIDRQVLGCHCRPAVLAFGSIFGITFRPRGGSSEGTHAHRKVLMPVGSNLCFSCGFHPMEYRFNFDGLLVGRCQVQGTGIGSASMGRDLATPKEKGQLKPSVRSDVLVGATCSSPMRLFQKPSVGIFNPCGHAAEPTMLP